MVLGLPKIQEQGEDLCEACFERKKHQLAINEGKP